MNNLQKFFEEIYYESNSLKTIQKLELILDKIENVSSHLNEASTCQFELNLIGLQGRENLAEERSLETDSHRDAGV